jgi:hypothetical protein
MHDEPPATADPEEKSQETDRRAVTWLSACSAQTEFWPDF